jgi:hypothetical protein
MGLEENVRAFRLGRSPEKGNPPLVNENVD